VRERRPRDAWTDDDRPGDRRGDELDGGRRPRRFRTGASAEVLVDTVAFPVYRRTTLARLGPFDEELVRTRTTS
jgi:hypothetical protein